MNRKILTVAGAVVALVLTGYGTAVGQSAVEPITRTCEGFTEHAEHTGFQTADEACVSTEFGEQSAQENNPQLLIVGAPNRVRANQSFEIKVSTRNLVRDRFLKAADGGYYLESGTLNSAGLTRGHFHTACRQLTSLRNAPEPLRNDIFVATEDGGGGSEPDTVKVSIANGLPRQGTWQCASWAGDGSHRTPMMAFANQIPAFDSVRIEVRGEKRWDGRDNRSKRDRDRDED